MTSLSTYQPFLIGEGQSKTGLFSYLESWVKPEDAFDELLDAYVYRGSIWKRNGSTLYPSTPGAGSLVYQNCLQIGHNTGGAVSSYAYNDAGGVIFNVLPIIDGSVVIKALTSVDPVVPEVFTDNGDGTLTGSYGDTGTIDYTNGQWTLTMGGGRTITNNTYIWGCWNFASKYVTSGGPFTRPIMMIATFINETTNAQITVIADTRRLAWYDSSVPVFVPVNTLVNEFLVIATAVSPVNFTFPAWINPASVTNKITGFSVTITDGTSTVVDLGDGTLSANGNITGGTINYNNGIGTITVTAPNTNTYTISLTLSGDYFTGDYTNFFNWTNWKPTDLSTAYLYMTNNVDRITLFDGTNLSRPPFFTKFADIATMTNDITTALDVKVYKNSFLVIRPTIVGASSPEAQTIRSSKPFVPTNLASDVTGNGVATVCPTGDWIMSTEFLRDAIVVFFLKSTWLFRFTQNAFDPFRFDKINTSRNTNAPYGSVEYDLQCTSMGNKGLIFCDGNNVDRYDHSIIDQFLEIEPRAFNQCFSLRFDTLNQTWMLYPSTEDATAGNTKITSSRVLLYNFLEKTWAIYRRALSCIGQGSTVTDLTWASFAPGAGPPAGGKTWQQWDIKWNAYLNLASMPALLGGDQEGFIFELDSGEKDNETPIVTSILTKRLNPFKEIGQKATFGYLDVYYEVAPEVILTFNLNMNNSESSNLTKTMTLNSTNASNTFAWQRLYLNVVGEFIQIQITDNGVSQFKILGMILHAAPSGRFTPGQFL